MNAQHTPGPWNIDTTGDGQYMGNDILMRIVAGKDEKGYDIQVIGGCGCCGSPWGNGEHALYDRQLLAAAPELYEALRVALRALEPDAKDVEKAFAMARAALAKADGKQ